jgi:hypothetical protein
MRQTNSEIIARKQHGCHQVYAPAVYASWHPFERLALQCDRH